MTDIVANTNVDNFETKIKLKQFLDSSRSNKIHSETIMSEILFHIFRSYIYSFCYLYKYNTNIHFRAVRILSAELRHEK